MKKTIWEVGDRGYLISCKESERVMGWSSQRSRLVGKWVQVTEKKWGRINPSITVYGVKGVQGVVGSSVSVLGSELDTERFIASGVIARPAIFEDLVSNMSFSSRPSKCEFLIYWNQPTEQEVLKELTRRGICRVLQQVRDFVCSSNGYGNDVPYL